MEPTRPPPIKSITTFRDKKEKLSSLLSMKVILRAKIIIISAIYKANDVTVSIVVVNNDFTTTFAIGNVTNRNVS